LGSILGYYVGTGVIIVLYTLLIVTVIVEALFPLLHYHYHCIIIIIIIIIGATGTISESFRTYLSNKPGKHDIKKLQKTQEVDPAHIIKKKILHTYLIYYIFRATVLHM
jgi:hypothetical protein